MKHTPITKEKTTLRGGMEQTIYVAIDFEAVNKKGLWWACGIVVCETPSQKVLFSHMHVCKREKEDFDDTTMKFWKNHPGAFNLLKNFPRTRPPAVCEAQICTQLTTLFATYPKVFFLSDNPQFDIAILDSMLQRHDLPTIAHRCENMYMHTICTRSFFIGAKMARRGHVSRMYYPQGSELQRLLVSGFDHTPIKDAARIISQHLAVLKSLSMA